uniref:Uncharacterized protein n=1 Tax=Aegilops tauschii TaxID=37682 RepID=M8BYK2_AEGTA
MEGCEWSNKEAAGEAESHGTAVKRARAGDCGENADDLISTLPDDILGNIISLLPTVDGGRTPVRTRTPGVPVAASSPVSPAAIFKIISQHHGPARRFYFNCRGAGYLYRNNAQSWLRSPALANLQELDLSYAEPRLLASVVLCFASTLLVAKIEHCDFPVDTVPPMNFPLLTKLTLFDVSVSEEVFHRLLSGCHVLESLYMAEVRAGGCFRVSSRTIKSITFGHSFSEKAELVIDDAPRLLSLLLTDCNRDDRVTIRVIRAPNLEILGPFLVIVSKLLLFQGISPVGSTNSMRTVKVLTLRVSGDKLDSVLNILRCFPCLEELHVIFQEFYEMDKENEPQYDPLHPIECLEIHLKKVVFKSFLGYLAQRSFARFFVLNAKVATKIEFEVNKDYDNRSEASQRWLL